MGHPPHVEKHMKKHMPFLTSSPPPPQSPQVVIPLIPALDMGLQLRLLFPVHHQHVVSRVINLHCDETQPDVRIREATGEAACLAQPPPPESATR